MATQAEKNVFVNHIINGVKYAKRADGYISMGDLIQLIREADCQISWIASFIKSFESTLKPITAFRDDVWCHPYIFACFACLLDDDFLFSMTTECVGMDHYMKQALDVMNNETIGDVECRSVDPMLIMGAALLTSHDMCVARV